MKAITEAEKSSGGYSGGAGYRVETPTRLRAKETDHAETYYITNCRSHDDTSGGVPEGKGVYENDK